MKILFLVPRTVFDTKLARERFDYADALDMYTTSSIQWSGPGWANWNDTFSVVENIASLAQKGDCDIVLSYMVEGLAESPLPVVVQFNEANKVPQVENYVRRNKIRIAIFHYLADYLLYSHWDDDPTMPTRVSIPHAARTDVFFDRQQEKTIDVLITGNLNADIYPLRHRLYLLGTRVLRKRGYRVVVLPHPGYMAPWRKGAVVGEDYARALNRAKLVFTCSSRFKYALTKYSEIALSRSLAVSDLPAERHDFFRDTVLNVESWMLDDEIQRRIEDVLDAPQELVLRTTRAYDLSLGTSTTKHYAGVFIKQIVDVLEGRA